MVHLAPLLLCLVPLAAAQKDNAPDCSCFRTTDPSSAASAPTYFQYHRFWDFRNISRSLVSVPTLLTTANASSAAPVASSYFSSSQWKNDWMIQNWNNSGALADNAGGNSSTGPTILMVQSPNNVYIGMDTFCPKQEVLANVPPRKRYGSHLLVCHTPDAPYRPAQFFPEHCRGGLGRGVISLSFPPRLCPCHRIQWCLCRSVYLPSPDNRFNSCRAQQPCLGPHGPRSGYRDPDVRPADQGPIY
jgi:hypothetical protein